MHFGQSSLSGGSGHPGQLRHPGQSGHSTLYNLHTMHFASFSVLSSASLYGFSVMFHPPFPSEISSAFNLCPYQSSTMACLSSPESTGKLSCNRVGQTTMVRIYFKADDINVENL